MNMISEWFVIPSNQEQRFRDWLLQNPEYRFRPSPNNPQVYSNQLETYRGASKNDVICTINYVEGGAKDKVMVTINFKPGTTDEGLLGLMHTTFTILDAQYPKK